MKDKQNSGFALVEVLVIPAIIILPGLVLDPNPGKAAGNQTDPIRWKLDCFVKREEAEPSVEPSTGP